MPGTFQKQFQFKEQIAFLLGKVNVPTLDWTGVWRDQHDSAFMVAGAYKADLLQSLLEAVNSAITVGRSLADFRKDFDRIIEATGWSYNGSRGWRTRLIYETNMRTSYQAGRYAQLTEPAFLKAYPLWRYKHSELVSHPRPEHLAWNGLVIAADDPWWQLHYPPNGWGCKCTVFSESVRSAERRGYTVSPAPPVELVDKVVGKNTIPRTVQVPKGIDPGWDYAPGAQRAPQVRAQVLEKAGAFGGQIGLDLIAAVSRIPQPPKLPEGSIE